MVSINIPKKEHEKNQLDEKKTTQWKLKVVLYFPQFWFFFLRRSYKKYGVVLCASSRVRACEAKYVRFFLVAIYKYSQTRL